MSNVKKKKDQTSTENVRGAAHTLDYAVRENAELTRETIKEWFIKDVKGIYILLAEMLNSDEAIEALVTVFYNRYVEMHKQKNEDANK